MADNKKEKIGIQDIAKVLNISASTVSRALNNHPRISKKTKDKVRQVAKRMGYYYQAPEVISPEKAEAVVVLTPSLEYAFYREIIAGVRDYFRKKDYFVFVLETDAGDDFVVSFFKSYKKYGVSGIIHILCDKKVPSDFYSIPLNDVLPVVSVFEPEEETGVSSVLPDIFQGIYKSVSYLNSLNANKIALLLENRNKPEDDQIVSSFESSFESLGISSDKLCTYYLSDENDGVSNILRSMLKRNNMPDVIFVKNVASAYDLENETERLGINIPEDLLLVTIDTESGTKRLTNNMSLIKLPGYEMGEKAASLLMDQINDPEADKKTAIVPVNFILKGSAMRIK